MCCSGVRAGGRWLLGAEGGAVFVVVELGQRAVRYCSSGKFSSKVLGEA
jgi:hypothetical protein